MLFVALSRLVRAGMEADMHYSPVRIDTASPFPPLGIPSNTANPARKIVALRGMLVYFIFSSADIPQIFDSVVKRIAIYVVYLCSRPMAIKEKPCNAVRLKLDPVNTEDYVFPDQRASRLAFLPSLSVDGSGNYSSHRVVTKNLSHKVFGDFGLVFGHAFNYRTLS